MAKPWLQGMVSVLRCLLAELTGHHEILNLWDTGGALFAVCISQVLSAPRTQGTTKILRNNFLWFCHRLLGSVQVQMISSSKLGLSRRKTNRFLIAVGTVAVI